MQHRNLWLIIGCLAIVAGMAVPGGAALAACNPNATMIRVNVSSGGTQANEGDEFVPSISGDGRYVAFESGATNLVSGSPHNFGDIFVHDRLTCTTSRVSVASNGALGNGSSGMPTISTDGRYVAFQSSASNLVAGDTNNHADIFVRDLHTHQTTRVSVSSSGVEGDNDSQFPMVSSDGRFVAFTSYADNLVNGDTNGGEDVFVHNMQTGQTIRVSVASDGKESNGAADPAVFPQLSADGRYVAFSGSWSNLVANDTNGQYDVFIHDMQTGQTTRASVGSGGTEANDFSQLHDLSGNGQVVVFMSDATNLTSDDFSSCGQDCVNTFVHDMQSGITTLVSVASDGMLGDNHTHLAGLSADGRVVVLSSDATNLVTDDTNGFRDVFIHDNALRQTWRISLGANQVQGDGLSGYPVISADGHYVAFLSRADNLVSGDTNSQEDVFEVRVDVPPIPTDAPPIHYFTTLTLILTWSHVNNAIGYEIEVDTDKAFHLPLTVHDDTIPGNMLSTQISLTTNGVYYWRVRAKLANGGVSAWSTPEQITVNA